MSPPLSDGWPGVGEALMSLEAGATAKRSPCGCAFPAIGTRVWEGTTIGARGLRGLRRIGAEGGWAWAAQLDGFGLTCSAMIWPLAVRKYCSPA